MTTYAFPAITPYEMSLRIVTNTAEFRSPFTQAVQTMQRGGEHVELSMSFRNLRIESQLSGTVAATNHGAVIMGFLSKLNGKQHRFTIPYKAKKILGVWSSNPTVDGAGQVGTSLLIADSGTIIPYNFIGDWFSVENHLHICTDTVNMVSGAATLTFRPAIRTAPSNGAAVDWEYPTGTFMLAEDPEYMIHDGAEGRLVDVTIRAIEDITS